MTKMEKRGTFTVYNAGKFNGAGPDLWMFNFYKADGSYGSSSLVPEDEAAAMRRSVIDLGYEPKRQSALNA